MLWGVWSLVTWHQVYAFVNRAFIRQIARCNVNPTVHRMSVFKKRGTVSLAMMENMVSFATWNVLVLAVDHVKEEMEYVGYVQNIGLIFTVIRHVLLTAKLVTRTVKNVQNVKKDTWEMYVLKPVLIIVEIVIKVDTNVIAVKMDGLE